MTEPQQETNGPITLNEDQQDILRIEVAALLRAVSGMRRDTYEALAAAVNQGEVSGEMVRPLEELVALLLETRRARQIYKAEGERVLTELFHETPKGKEMTRQLAAVNRALVALRGQSLSGVRIGMRTIGHFTVTINTKGANLTLGVQPRSVVVESVETGGDEEAGA